MRTFEELISQGSPAIDAIRRAVGRAENPSEMLPPSEDRERVLVAVQVGVDAALGALAYETGGILVDQGWLRVLGSGHARLARNLADWNKDRAEGLYLVADDVVGGFFAVNAGAFGAEPDMYYWAPDSLAWEPIGFEFDFFLQWSLTAALGEFYQHLRWTAWPHDVAGQLPADHSFVFEPPLWSPDGSVTGSARSSLPVDQVYARKLAAQRESGA